MIPNPPQRPSIRPDVSGCEHVVDTSVLDLEVPATEWNATLLRRRFGDWLGSDASDPRGEDLIFAVYEALANTVQHAYLSEPDKPGPMRLLAHRGTREVSVTITDHGRWQLAHHPGRGLRLIRALVTRVGIERGGIDTTDGTRVHLHTALPAQTQPPVT